MTLGAF
jgi:hypothetical protein